MNHFSTILGKLVSMEVMLVILITILFLLPITALIDVLRGRFKENDKLIWVIIIIFIPLIGSIIYFLIGTNQKLNE